MTDRKAAASVYAQASPMARRIWHFTLDQRFEAGRKSKMTVSRDENLLAGGGSISTHNVNVLDEQAARESVRGLAGTCQTFSPHHNRRRADPAVRRW